MLQDQVIAEIKAIPEEKLLDVYRLIHEFRLKLPATPSAKKQKTVDEVFGKLYKKEQKAVSIEEMNLAIQNRIKNKFK